MAVHCESAPISAPTLTVSSLISSGCSSPLQASPAHRCRNWWPVGERRRRNCLTSLRGLGLSSQAQLIWKLVMVVFTILQEKSMKPVLAFSYLVLSAALIPAAGFAQNAPAQQATADSAQAAANSAQAAANSAQATANSAQATVPQNTEIASKIEAEMASQNVASITGINVSADSTGVVSLTGSARSQDDIDKVVSIAQNTAGVSAVNNSVRVQPQ